MGYNKTQSNKKGFTLVELLVVIAIISILSTTVLASLESARAAARDASRINKIEQLTLALELYYSDNGYYPQIRHALGIITTCANVERYGEPYSEEWGHCGRWRVLQEELEPYLQINPSDYTEAGQGLYHFNYTSQDGEANDPWGKYGLEVRLENTDGISRTDGGIRDSWYEVGQNPGYCAKTYTGSDTEWLNKNDDYTLVCAGGN